MAQAGSFSIPTRLGLFFSTANPSLRRLLDLWEATPQSKRQTRMRQAQRHLDQSLQRQTRGSAVKFDDTEDDDLEDPAWVDQTLLAHAKMLCGDWEAARAMAADADVLGWSSSDTPPRRGRPGLPGEILARPLWFLSPGGRPVWAEVPPPDSAWWCREGDSEWKPISSDGWKQPSAFFAATQKGPEDRTCLDDARCESSHKPANGDEVSAATDKSNNPNQAREFPPRVIYPRRATHRRKHRPAPGQGTLFFVQDGIRERPS